MIDEKKLDKEIAGWFKEAIDNGHHEIDTVDTSAVVRHIIDKQPKVGEWIPCSEMLPEDTKTKIITLSDGSVESGYYSEKNWWCVGDSINLEVKKDVIAWQPLPEPYEEDAEK